MARIRTIKPDFFLHDRLAEQPFAHRLLFIGLWTLADRDGRIEDHPKRIKAALFPWDDIDMDAALNDLAAGGFVVRYEVDGVGVVAIPSWGRHQRPHVREAQSCLPEPPKHNLGSAQAQPRQCSAPALTMPSPGDIPPGTAGRERKGREGKDVREDAAGLVLEEQKAGKPPRALSRQERFMAWAQAERKLEDMLPDVRWPIPRINAELADLVEQPNELITDAYRAFLADERQREKFCPMAFFAADWPRYAAKAMKAMENP